MASGDLTDITPTEYRADVVVWPGDDLGDVLDPLAGLVLGPERTARHVFVDGEYVVRVRDLNNKGGDGWVYYLEADLAKPDGPNQERAGVARPSSTPARVGWMPAAYKPIHTAAPGAR